MKAIGQLKYQLELNFRLYVPSICVLSNAPQSAFRRILVGYLHEFCRGKTSPLPEYTPFLLIALNKAHCEGIEVAQGSSSFITAEKHRLLKKDVVAGTDVKICREYSPISKSVAASEAMK